jgi:hypothetical protein
LKNAASFIATAVHDYNEVNESGVVIMYLTNKSYAIRKFCLLYSTNLPANGRSGPRGYHVALKLAQQENRC